MVCPDCGGVIEEHHKTEMLREKGYGGEAEWIPTAPDNADIARRGYHVSALYSPVGWKSWAAIAKDWQAAQGNPKKLQAFINNVLAETWEERGERIDEHALMERAEHYGVDLLPAGVLALTVGVDVQPDRLECEVVGWGVGEESWSIEYRVIRGDPNGALVWQQLDLFLASEYQHPVGIRLRPARTFVDSGGSNTQAVYDYTRGREHMGVYAIKGVGGDGKPAVGLPSKNNIGKVPLFPLGANTLKDTVYGRLKIEEPGPGFCHFPRSYPAEFYKGLTAEEVRVKYTKGHPVREWHKRAAHVRNEPLDCRCYATGAMVSLNLNFEQLATIIAGTYVDPGRVRRVRGQMDAGAGA